MGSLQWTSIPSSRSNTIHIPSSFNYDTETIVRILAYFATTNVRKRKLKEKIHFKQCYLTNSVITFDT